LTRDRLFWILTGIAAAALLCIYVFWARNVGRRVAEEVAALQDTADDITTLSMQSKQIPNKAGIRDMEEYKNWTADQTKQVMDFFRVSDRYLETYVVASPNVAPEVFKASYGDRINELVKRLDRIASSRFRKMTVSKSLFVPEYPWHKAEGLPDPSVFKPVSNELCIRVYLLDVIEQSGARELRMIKVDKPEKVTDLVSRIPVSFVAVLPSLKVTTLLDKLLKVTKGATRLCVLIRKMKIGHAVKGKDDPGAARLRGLLAMNVELDVLDFNFPEEKKVEKKEAEKKAASAGKKE